MECILASGNLNWLIADDVGLGKTIEVGMLLAALEQRGMFRRILLVTPAGLTRQWQDELHQKFGMSDFQIYGEDFHIREARQWKLYDHVIGSIDRLKAEEHQSLLLGAEPWDLIVFDEAHRLSRRQFGRKYEAAQRFRLAARLRQTTDAMLLLSATPHQGMQDRFQALLELLRPEWKKDIQRLALNPHILKDMVIRNNKADVTDAQGAFIFRGKTTRAIEVPVGDQAREFDRSLQDYLRRGYAAGRRLGRQGIPIGFVMTIYRKLAASSGAAIHQALLRRRARLLEKVAQAEETSGEPDDARYAGEWEETFSGSAKEFFTGEIDLLEKLIAEAWTVHNNDRKVAAFLDELVAQVLHANPKEKVVIFTEYRATQQHLAEVLGKRFGENNVALIHGSQKHDHRASAISHFEDEGQFLISTEAGGEGINLHRRCHIMVNFDLPWNPMRLVQRIGRLYRYGQDKRVIVFNVHAPQTLDAEIMGLMYRRVEQVVNDMAVLGGEFDETLADDILGELADLLDVEQILEEAMEAGIQRSRDRIEEALARAREALEKQRELFEYVTGYDPNELRHDLAVSGDHVRSFVEGMFASLGIEVVNTLHKGLVWEIRLPEQLAQEIPGLRQHIRVTLDRTWGAARPDIHMLDLQSPLMKSLLEKAKAYDAGGLCASLKELDGKALLTSVLRWQNDQGRRMRREFAAFQVRSDGSVSTNPAEFSEWLLRSAADGTQIPEKGTTKPLLDAAVEAADRRLSEVSNADLHPETRQWVSGSWL